MKRIITAAIAIPVVLLITIYSPDWLFAAVIGLVSAAAADEFLSLGERKGIGRPRRWFLALPALVAISFLFGSDWIVGSLVGAALLLMSAAVFSGNIEKGLGTVVVGLSGLLYCSGTLGFLIRMPRPWILLLFAIIWVGDTAAYYGGRALGRHLLAPIVSPKKTVEGAIAGLAGSVVVGAVCGVWFLHQPLLNMIGISAATAIVGQIGDLAESVLKRSAGVKDSSSILPGHGGILDRLDSLFFATPIFYWLLNA
ncbi:MAG TPA: phosphatidate cytidylyltransferase [Terriglobia bacterium]|nr:phosphatidate cytidylyltransferase [Terriglobia bacterium]